MKGQTLKESIIELGPWFHQIEIKGHWTRDIAPAPGPQPRNHPHNRWRAISHALPDLRSKRVLDLGSADGYFSIELARLGAVVDAVDLGVRMVDRLKWAAEQLGLDINARVGSVEEIAGVYDYVFFFCVLYHLRNPLLGLEKVARLSDTMFLETAVAEGDEPYLWFKPPQEGVHSVAKWFPTVRCLEDMLRFVGYGDLEPLPCAAKNRVMYLCRK